MQFLLELERKCPENPQLVSEAGQNVTLHFCLCLVDDADVVGRLDVQFQLRVLQTSLKGLHTADVEPQYALHTGDTGNWSKTHMFLLTHTLACTHTHWHAHAMTHTHWHAHTHTGTHTH